MTQDCTDLHIELLSSMFQVHRALKADPEPPRRFSSDVAATRMPTFGLNVEPNVL